jgi:mRNA interferase MazF
MPIEIDLLKTQRYLDWLKTKLYLDTRAINAKSRMVKRGEVYRCNLGLGIGSEENKERPCVILQYDAGNKNSPNTIVAPITHSSSTLPIVVPIADKFDPNGTLLLDGHVLLGNIVCVSKARLGDFLIKLEPEEMEAVDTALAISTDLKHHYDKLMRIHEDKLDYIEKLKTKYTTLEHELVQEKEYSNKVKALQVELGFKDIDSFIQHVRENI